jgi:putative transcriptional regulator
MPIKLNLDRVMSERQISLTELADRIGITLANLSVLKTNKARAIRFTTLEALCRELKCQPGDLLEFTPGLDTRSGRQEAPSPDTARKRVDRGRTSLKN